MSTVTEELLAALGATRVALGEEIAQRATSYWDQSPTSALALVKPRSTEEVSTALSLCHRRGQPVVIQGGLTGCVEGAVAAAGEVIVSLERMNRIESIDARGMTATVQAGVVLEVLQQAASERNLLFPLDLGARGSCTIGGNIATNAGGINVLRYGMMRNLVLGLEAVTADGTVISSMNRMLKNNAGYDLKQLFIGSEGTLGIVTKAVLKLFPRPAGCGTALVAAASFDALILLLNRLQRSLAGTLSAFEAMWGDYFRGVTGESGHRAPMSRDHPFYAVVEAEGSDAEADGERFERVLAAALEDGEIAAAVISGSESHRRAIWAIREDFEDLLPARLYDVSLPMAEMDGYIRRVRDGLEARRPGSACYTLGHIADGNLHLFVKPGAGGDSHRECDEEVYGPLPELGGSVSAEHGIGSEKIAWLSRGRSAAEIALMRSVKRALDPRGLLNPGRVLG